MSNRRYTWPAKTPKAQEPPARQQPRWPRVVAASLGGAIALVLLAMGVGSHWDAYGKRGSSDHARDIVRATREPKLARQALLEMYADARKSILLLNEIAEQDGPLSQHARNYLASLEEAVREPR